MTTLPDYYGILQVADTAEDEMIQFAYRRLATKWHPDKNPGNPAAADRMRLLNEAYEVLSDSLKRRQYDAERKSSDSTFGASTPPPQPATRTPHHHNESVKQSASTEHEACPGEQVDSDLLYFKRYLAVSFVIIVGIIISRNTPIPDAIFIPIWLFVIVFTAWWFGGCG